LIKDVGEAGFIKGVRAVTMPVCSFVIADVLNDTGASIGGYFRDGVPTSSFIAPSAKVLIVDDISTNLTVAEGLLSKYRMKIDTCKSGFEAVRLAAVNRYDIIFMDQTMPEMDGIAATGAIRSLEGGEGYYKNAPIIALTANAVTGMKEIFLQNGFSDFLPKPIDIIKLGSILKNWIPAEKQEASYEQIKDERGGNSMEIEGIDMQSGISLNGGSMENYIRTLKVFVIDAEEKIAELRDSLQKNDIRLYTTLVHGLKSASANVGAKKVADFARTLEQAGKSEAVLFIIEHNEELMTELEKLLQSIKGALKGENEGSGGNASDIDFLKNSLTELKTALDNLEAGKINRIMDGLESKHWDKKNEDIISDLSQFVLLYDYDKAIALIEDTLR
jgi:CheY-like chemotaxis protein